MEEDTIHTHILICDEFSLLLTVNSLSDEIDWADALGLVVENEINIANEEEK